MKLITLLVVACALVACESRSQLAQRDDVGGLAIRFVTAASESCKAEIDLATGLIDHAVKREKLAIDSTTQAHAQQMVDAEYRHAQAVSRICNTLANVK